MSTFSWDEALRALYPMERGEHIEPLSDLWFKVRRGRITASARARTLASKQPGSWLTMQQEIRAELRPDYESQPFSNEYTRWGQKYEPEAIANLEFELDIDIQKCGFLLHPELYFCGATPDGLIGNDTTLQVKCPWYEDRHNRVFYEKQVPKEYYHQVQFEAWITERPKIIFASYHPNVPPESRCAIVRLDANLELWKVFDEHAREFKESLERGSVMVKPIDTLGIPNIF